MWCCCCCGSADAWLLACLLIARLLVASGGVALQFHCNTPLTSASSADVGDLAALECICLAAHLLLLGLAILAEALALAVLAHPINVCSPKFQISDPWDGSRTENGETRQAQYGAARCG